METTDGMNAMKEKTVVSDKHLAELSDEELNLVLGGCNYCDIAREVINGDWGTGEEQKRRLRAAGFDYGEIMNIVHKMLSYPQRHHID